MARPSGQASGAFAMRRVLDPEGKMVGRGPDLPDSDLVSMYRTMIVSRTFDERMVSLQRQGRVGTYAPVSGQEAAQVGAVRALTGADWLFPTYRDYAALYAFGMPLERLVLYPMGHPDGGIAPKGAHIYPISISIATHLPHAVGAAYALRQRGEPGVVLATHGDGATSKGDFHEAMNFAGVFKVPMVFLCQNNGWAISVPRHRQTAARTLAQKAAAYGMEGVQVDGNDLLAVYQTVSEAVARARDGQGATLIEAVTYRLGPHTTADDPTRYRSGEELERMEQTDPLTRVRRLLEGRGVWDAGQEGALREDAKAVVAEAVKKAEATPPADPAFFFDLAYETPTAPLEKQRRAFVPEEAER